MTDRIPLLIVLVCAGLALVPAGAAAVTAEPGSLFLRVQNGSQADADIAVTHDGATGQDVELSVTGDASTLLTVSPDTVMVPADGAATATVTAAPLADAAAQAYSGHIVLKTDGSYGAVPVTVVVPAQRPRLEVDLQVKEGGGPGVRYTATVTNLGPAPVNYTLTAQLVAEDGSVVNGSVGRHRVVNRSRVDGSLTARGTVGTHQLKVTATAGGGAAASNSLPVVLEQGETPTRIFGVEAGTLMIVFAALAVILGLVGGSLYVYRHRREQWAEQYIRHIPGVDIDDQGKRMRDIEIRLDELEDEEQQKQMQLQAGEISRAGYDQAMTEIKEERQELLSELDTLRQQANQDRRESRRRDIDRLRERAARDDRGKD